MFASELKGLLHSPLLSRRLDREGLLDYLRHGYIPDPRSILDGVPKLPPGHTLYARAGKPEAPRPYWRAAPIVPHGPTQLTGGAGGRRPRGMLDASVCSRLPRDVPAGAVTRTR